MTKFTKLCITILFVVISISGLLVLVFCGKDFFKSSFSNPIDFNTYETDNLVENTLVSGDVQYVVDTIASAYIDSSSNAFNYYLVPVKSQKYIIVATSDSDTISAFSTIYQETCEFLSGNIEDTSTSVSIDGKLIPLDDSLKSMLYSWNDSTNYFDTSTMDDEIIPYVIYTQNFATLRNWAILSMVLIVVGVAGAVVSIKVIKVNTR